MNEYKIDFKHIINGNTETIKLGNTKTIARLRLKDIQKDFSIWWRKSLIYC